MLRPELQQLPPSFRTARAYHVGVHPSRPPLELIHQLRTVVRQHPAGNSRVCHTCIALFKVLQIPEG